MFTFACKDAGVDCNFIAAGSSVEEVKKAAFAHAEVAHKEILQSMTLAQLDELARAVETNTMPA